MFTILEKVHVMMENMTMLKIWYAALLICTPGWPGQSKHAMDYPQAPIYSIPRRPLAWMFVFPTRSESFAK